MRSKVVWSIKNKTANKAFWAVYKTSDDLCRSSLRDLDGEIGAGQTINIDVPEDKLKLGFWKSLPTLLFGGERITEPEVFETKRSVALVEGKKHEVGPVGEFGEGGSGVTFLDSHAGRMSDNDIIRAIFLAPIGLIPKAGEGIKFVLGLLWPEEAKKPEELMRQSEERMKRWVQGLINQYDLRSMTETLSGLRRNLAEYHNAEDQRRRQEWMGQCVASFNNVIDHFIKSDYTPGTIKLAVDLATLHLALLRERAVFAKDIYGDELGKQRYLSGLEGAIKEYQQFFGAVAIPGELAWREQQTQLEEQIGRSNKVYGYYLKDSVTREVHSFAYTGRSLNQGPAKVCVDFYRAQARNSYERQMLEQVYDPALLWSRFYPGKEGDRPIAPDRVVWTGPYAGLSYMVGNEHNMNFGDSEHQGPGTLTGIRVRAWDRIDALRFDFDGREGRWFGNTGGGTEYPIAVPTGVHLTAIETWWNFDLFAICLHFSDGSSRKFGKHGPGEVRQYASYADHRVSAVRLAPRMHEMYVGFSPLPDYYERLQKK